MLHNIDETNRHYGGARYPDATKTIFPNGEVDPWHWESTLIGEDPHVDTIFVKGASHCEWMHAVKPGMPGGWKGKLHPGWLVDGWLMVSELSLIFVYIDGVCCIFMGN